MTAVFIIFCENVEEKGLHVVIQRLVVQEKLGKQAEVLAIDLAHVAINLVRREKMNKKSKRKRNQDKKKTKKKNTHNHIKMRKIHI